MNERTHVKQSAASDELCPLNRHYRQLHHLGHKPVTSKLFGNAPHHELVSERTDEERDQGCHVARHVWSRSPIDMATKEVVDRNVPFAGKLKP